jgi:hypothetical protein
MERLPSGSQVQAAPVLLKQRHFERFGELLQLQGYGGLGEVQLGGGARDAAQSGDGFEYEKLRKQPMTEETTQLGA